MKRSQIAHPAWCDPELCDVSVYRDGTAEVFHRAWLLDSRHGKEWLRVELWRYVGYSPGGVVVSDSTDVFVRGLDCGEGRIPPEELPDVVAALQLAAELTGYRT